jgi:hypothetical protein
VASLGYALEAVLPAPDQFDALTASLAPRPPTK